jgi:hypothetical protein
MPSYQRNQLLSWHCKMCGAKLCHLVASWSNSHWRQDLPRERQQQTLNQAVDCLGVDATHDKMIGLTIGWWDCWMIGWLDDMVGLLDYCWIVDIVDDWMIGWYWMILDDIGWYWMLTNPNFPKPRLTCRACTVPLCVLYFLAESGRDLEFSIEFSILGSCQGRLWWLDQDIFDIVHGCTWGASHIVTMNWSYWSWNFTVYK